MTIAWADFEAAVRAAHLDPLQRSVNHWQIRGGDHLVNFYPLGSGGTPRIYVAGAGKGASVPYKGAIRAAIDAAYTPPKVAKVVKKRKSTYKSHKRRMLKKDPRCHWCETPLSMDGAAEGTVPATLDHRIPLGAGGLDNPNNYVLACEACNQDRGCETAAPARVEGLG
jgi:hypothetical protein